MSDLNRRGFLTALAGMGAALIAQEPEPQTEERPLDEYWPWADGDGPFCVYDHATIHAAGTYKLFDAHLERWFELQKIRTLINSDCQLAAARAFFDSCMIELWANQTLFFQSAAIILPCGLGPDGFNIWPSILLPPRTTIEIRAHVKKDLPSPLTWACQFDGIRTAQRP